MVFRGTCNSAGGIKVKSKKEMGGRGQNHGGGASARRGWTPIPHWRLSHHVYPLLLWLCVLNWWWGSRAFSSASSWVNSLLHGRRFLSFYHCDRVLYFQFRCGQAVAYHWISCYNILDIQSRHHFRYHQWRTALDNCGGGAHIHIFVFKYCRNNRFKKDLFMQNTNI